mgnify:CR=1 FL=1
MVTAIVTPLGRNRWQAGISCISVMVEYLRNEEGTGSIPVCDWRLFHTGFLMKDYERLYRACVILAGYERRRSSNNLYPAHDVIQLHFDVSPDQLSKEDKKHLKDLGAIYSEGEEFWKMFISC